MKLFRSIAALLRKGAPGFSVLETELLREVERQLDVDRADKLRRRVESINLVQRLDGGREVNAYSMKNGQPSFDESLRLTDESDEQKLATFSFHGSDQRSYEGAMWLVNGQLFSMEFNNITEHVLEYPPTDVKLSICV
jgi:hypothetical protein